MSMELRRKTAFWLLATVLTMLLFASSVPSPLYVVYQQEWGFSSLTLTSVFAVYAIALLAALLVVGSISDHVGRRPTMIAALALEVVAMLAFAGASGVGWLFAARIMQGLATGAALGAISAALLDLQPSSKPWLGALIGAVGPLAGLALGALAAGLLVDYGPDPTRFVFWLLVAAFAIASLAVLAMPETVDADRRWRAALRPRVAVPSEMRVAFVASVPSLAATWALGGLVLSLGASLTAGVLGESSHLAAGLPIFVMAGISAVASIWLRDVNAQLIARGGLVALIAGVAVALAALAAESSVLFLVGGAVAGLGFGPAYAGVFRALSAYLAFSLPAIIAGAAVPELGLRQTAELYGAALIAVAVLALIVSGRLQHGVRPDPVGPVVRR
jgi:MFS family permease